MDRPRRSTVVGVVLSVVAAAVVVVSGWAVLACHAPRDQTDMISAYRADPIFAAAPNDGQLVKEWSRTNSCDAEHDGGGSGYRGFADVGKVYRTPVAYSLGQLHQLFDQPAAAGGWTPISSDQDSTFLGADSSIGYCRQTGNRASYAAVASSNTVTTEFDSDIVVGVRVSISASLAGERCDVL